MANGRNTPKDLAAAKPGSDSTSTKADEQSTVAHAAEPGSSTPASENKDEKSSAELATESPDSKVTSSAPGDDTTENGAPDDTSADAYVNHHGARKDADVDGTIDAPVSGDDTEHGQPVQDGQVAPTDEVPARLGNPDGASVPTPVDKYAQGAYRDAHPDETAFPENGQDIGAGQPTRKGQVAPLDPSSVDAAATPLGIATPGVTASPSASPLDPPKPRTEGPDGKPVGLPKPSDAAVDALRNRDGDLLDSATGKAPDPDELFKPLFESGRGNTQVCQVRLVQVTAGNSRVNSGTKQVALSRGAHVSDEQAAVILARVRAQAARDSA